MSSALEDVRKKIDSLDDRIHDLLMERADLISQVSEEKKKSGTPVVQPAREAKMIRRLLARHRGPLPEAAIVRIWRELVGAVSLLQTGLKVSVSNGEGHQFCWDMAKDYFGGSLPMVKTSAPVASVTALRDDEVSFAVLPWPLDGEAQPWWSLLMGQDKDKMKIVCAMPYGVMKDQPPNPQHRALVVSKTDYAPSGEDRSFFVLQIPRTVSRAKIIDELKNQNLNVLGINTKVNGSDIVMHLVEVDDYLSDNDERLKTFAGKFEGAEVKTTILGGYPVPPVYKGVEKKSNV